MATKDYTADPNVKLLNPERGFYYNGDGLPDESVDYNDNLLSEETWDSDKPAHTIVPEWLWLAPWCDKDLVWDPTNGTTSKVLKDYANYLEQCRLAGVKVLFRPRYDQRDPDAQEGDPPEGPSNCTFEGGSASAKVFHANSLKRQKDHITAIANMLGDYKDVIAFIQAGYLGNWGEWNTGADDAGEYDMTNAPLLYTRPDRSAILDHILLAYAEAGIEQDVELRRPVFAQEVVERWKNHPEIYGIDAKPNVGLKNDCFMSSENISNEEWPKISGHDTGTYLHFFDFLTFSDLTASSDQKNLSKELDLETVEEARKCAEELTENSSFGGETCNSNGNERWRFCDNMTGETSEPASLHMNYLNGDFANFPDPAAEDGFSSAVDVWQKGGCYDDILHNLGYRFEVTCVEYTETVSAGDTFSVAVDVENNGWARLHKPRDAKLVLRNGATTHEYTFSGGPVSNWAPGTTTRISVSDSAPPPGTYSVRLWIPDPDLLDFLSNAPNPQDYEKAKTNYAVKLATLRDDGTNVFDQTTGENDLVGVEIKVQ